MRHWVSNIRVAMLVILAVGAVYALSAERTHTTKHQRSLKIAEQQRIDEQQRAIQVAYEVTRH